MPINIPKKQRATPLIETIKQGLKTSRPKLGIAMKYLFVAWVEEEKGECKLPIIFES